METKCFSFREATIAPAHPPSRLECARCQGLWARTKERHSLPALFQLDLTRSATGVITTLLPMSLGLKIKTPPQCTHRSLHYLFNLRSLAALTTRGAHSCVVVHFRSAPSERAPSISETAPDFQPGTTRTRAEFRFAQSPMGEGLP